MGGGVTEHHAQQLGYPNPELTFPTAIHLGNLRKKSQRPDNQKISSGGDDKIERQGWGELANAKKT